MAINSRENSICKNEVISPYKLPSITAAINPVIIAAINRWLLSKYLAL